MALYKYLTMLTQMQSEEFDKVYRPAIYVCFQ
jgi:hypothetical protein